MNNCDDSCDIKSEGEIQAEEKLNKWIRKIGFDEAEEENDSKGVNHDTFRF